MATAAGGAEALCLEERQVGARHRVHRSRPPRLLGSARLSQRRGPLARRALLVPGRRVNRETALARMRGEQFDLAVIGGGINGAAIARDASLRGLSVALVDRGDFA